MKSIMTTILVGLVLLAGIAHAQDSAVAPFVGDWAITPDGGGIGWLGVVEHPDWIEAGILWHGGSVNPAAHAYVEGDTLVVTVLDRAQHKNKDGKKITGQVTRTWTVRREGDVLKGTYERPNNNGRGIQRSTFTAKPEPPMPPKPNLKSVKFGKAINLIEKNSLKGWTPIISNNSNGWKVENGVLINDAPKKEGVRWANLKSDASFEDFNLKLEVNVPKHGNSGIYLRGIYEVQVEDSHGKRCDSHNMGAIYSRITPLVAAEKPAGEWQRMDITLVDRHLTVKLNGTLIIDNEYLPGCTGGALSSDVTQPGPLMLQGDHGPIQYRNIKLSPVMK